MIKEILAEYAQSIERKFEGRVETVGASEIGLCARKVTWAKRQNDHDVGFTQRWGAHVRGSVMEQAFWYPAMRMKFQDKLLFAGPDQRTFRDGKLSATPDGLVVDGDCFLIECKTIDPRVNMYTEREANHFQVQVQMGIVRAATQFKPNKAVISYVDASFWDEVAEFTVEYDEQIYAAAQARAAEILSKEPTELKPEGWIAGGKECNFCPFVGPCGVARTSVPNADEPADPQFAAEIADMCREALSAQTDIDLATRDLREVQQKIKDRLREKNVRHIPKVVVWSMQKGRTSYDMPELRAAAEAAGVDVEKYSTVGDPTDRLQILLGKSRGT